MKKVVDCGLWPLYRYNPDKEEKPFSLDYKKPSIPVEEFIGAMLAGRVVWGIVMMTIMGLSGSAFTWAAFAAGAFTNAIPGIIVHIVLIPALVMALQKCGILETVEMLSISKGASVAGNR